MIEKCVSIVNVRWAIGIGLTVLMAIAASFTVAFETRAQDQGNQRVLETRVDTLECGIKRITVIGADLSEMKSTQKVFQATVTSELNHIKESMESLKQETRR